MTPPFSNEEIVVARRLKAAGLAWEPQVGHYACEEPNHHTPPGSKLRIHLIEDLDRYLADFGSTEALGERLTWLPDWREGRMLLRRLGIGDEEVLSRLAREGYFSAGRELLGLYLILLEALEAPKDEPIHPQGGHARRAERLGREVADEVPLTEAQAGADPFDLFARWFKEAVDAPHIEPTAMALATVTASGGPSVRMVLLKGFDTHGFVFFTNQASRKARELAACPSAALTIWWDFLERQVRIEGPVEPTSEADADAYFATRPLGSQLGAWASPQSTVIPDRATLEAAVAEAAARFAGQPVLRPPFWGGYRLMPETIEFWQGRRDRLHDRLLYTRTTDGSWSRCRLAP